MQFFVINQDVETIKKIDHSSKLNKIDFEDPRLEQNIRMAGFRKAMQVDYIVLNHHLITTLCDRWRPETNIFHFRVEEMTVTLVNVYFFGLGMDNFRVYL